jgi:SH3-like domain-containing protein
MIAARLFRLSGALALAVACMPAPPGAAAETAIATAEARGPVTNLPLPRFVSMRAETANARRGPSLDQRVDWEFVQRGVPLEVVAEYGNWRKVRDHDGKGGWVHHTLLSGARTVLVLGSEAVALRAGPNPDSAVRAMAEPGVIGQLEACRDSWCEIGAGGVEGWVPQADIWGVGPGEMID